MPVGTPAVEASLEVPNASQLDSAASILADDPLMKQATNGRKYEIVERLPWYDFKRDLVGVAIQTRVTPPFEGTLAWRAVDYEPEATRGESYRSRTFSFDVADAALIDVRVDMQKRAVVGFVPGDGTKIKSQPAASEAAEPGR